MKKLLVILGTITLTGSGMTGIVGNAPNKKEQISKNNTESNFLQTKLKNINYKRQKWSNNEKINRTKVVITTNDYVDSSGVVLNNKVYFGSDDGNIYEYDPETEQKKLSLIKKKKF